MTKLRYRYFSGDGGNGPIQIKLVVTEGSNADRASAEELAEAFGLSMLAEVSKENYEWLKVQTEKLGA